MHYIQKKSIRSLDRAPLIAILAIIDLVAIACAARAVMGFFSGGAA